MTFALSYMVIISFAGFCICFCLALACIFSSHIASSSHPMRVQTSYHAAWTLAILVLTWRFFSTWSHVHVRTGKALLPCCTVFWPSLVLTGGSYFKASGNYLFISVSHVDKCDGCCIMPSCLGFSCPLVFLLVPVSACYFHGTLGTVTEGGSTHPVDVPCWRVFKMQ